MALSKKAEDLLYKNAKTASKVGKEINIIEYGIFLPTEHSTMTEHIVAAGNLRDYIEALEKANIAGVRLKIAQEE